jgi:ATP-dependent protease Clp ATPase subunit
MSVVPFYRCSFCWKSNKEVQTIITATGCCICDECVDECALIVVEDRAKKAAATTQQVTKDE